MSVSRLNSSATCAKSAAETLLAVVEPWRRLLASHCAGRGAGLSERELTSAIQRLLNRLVFLCACEGRGLAPAGQLQSLPDGPDIHRRLCELCGQIEGFVAFDLFGSRHNTPLADSSLSGMDEPVLADSVLNEVLLGFGRFTRAGGASILSAELPGQVYEQLLGTALSPTDDRRTGAAKKRDIRKGAGVYYTPSHIVDYIVRHTVGELLGEGDRADRTDGTDRTDGRRHSPGPISRLRILDPSCGAGALLLGAYQYLLDWHLQWYAAHDPESWARGENPPICRSSAPTAAPQVQPPPWRLTLAERRRILHEHLYGVDTDPMAVETARLSLFLKMLDDEPDPTSHRRCSRQSCSRPGDEADAFPPATCPPHHFGGYITGGCRVGNNLKRGNALIGPDSHQSHQDDLLAVEESPRIEGFDWEKEFPEVFSRGGGPRGFDAVIGNPPYLFGECHDPAAKGYFRSHFRLASEQYDTYWLFIERGFQLLTEGGMLGMIVPDALLARDETEALRRLLLDRGLERVYHCGPVFQAVVSSVVVIARPGSRSEKVISEIPKGTRAVHGRDAHATFAEHSCARERFVRDAKCRLLVHATDAEQRLLTKLETACAPLGGLIKITRGEETGKANVSKEGPIAILVGEDIARYRIRPPSRFICEIRKPPANYRAPKIVVVKTGDRIVAALDAAGHVTMQSVYNLRGVEPSIAPEAVLAILNSRLADFWVKRTCTAYKRLFPQINQSTLETFPVPKALAEKQGPLARLARSMIGLRAKEAESGDERERADLQIRSAALEKQLQRAVYEAYQLEEAEAALVESA